MPYYIRQMAEKSPDVPGFTLELFTAGVETWNRFRKAYPNEPLVLSGVDFEAADLSGYDMHDVQIVECDLSGALLRHANLTRARLGNVVLNGADLYGALFDGGFRWNVRACGANCESAIFAGATFDDVSFEDCSFVHAVFFQAHLSNSRFTGSDFTRAWLVRASAISLNPWVLDPIIYDDQACLLALLTEKVIVPAETKAQQQD